VNPCRGRGGRGPVVAEEVRKLAERSGSSAKEAEVVATALAQMAVANQEVARTSLDLDTP
jgi:methyl-accepting chemotaxis protein